MTELEREWLARLDERGGTIDLHRVAREGDPVMDDLLRTLTPPGLEMSPQEGSHVTARDDGLFVELTGLLVPVGADPEAAETGVLWRTFDTPTAEAHHRKLEIPEEHQGEFSGRLLVRNSAHLYEALGITSVHLVAVDVGKYVWAMCGFDFVDESVRREVISSVSELAEQVGLATHDFDHVEHSWELATLEEERPVTVGTFADCTGADLDVLPGEADILETEIRAGKALLLFMDHPGWHGVLDLSTDQESPGRQQLYDYTDTNGDSDEEQE